MVARVLFPVLTCRGTRSYPRHRATIKALPSPRHPPSPLRIIWPPVYFQAEVDAYWATLVSARLATDQVTEDRHVHERNTGKCCAPCCHEPVEEYRVNKIDAKRRVCYCSPNAVAPGMSCLINLSSPAVSEPEEKGNDREAVERHNWL